MTFINRKRTPSEVPWARYPVRVCRSMHSCELCPRTIRLGEQYFDGGYSRRAHVTCLPGVVEPTKAQEANQ